MVGDQLVELADSLERVEDAAGAEHCATLVEHAHVVVGLSPVHTNKDHRSLLGHVTSLEATAAT